jgi:hypothetical protein
LYFSTAQIHRRRHRLAAAAAAVLATGGLALVPPAPSQAAGTYVDLACDSSAPSISDGYGGWSSFASINMPGVDATNNCNGDLHASMYSGQFGNAVPLGHNVGWQFNAPSGTYISGVNMLVKGWLRAYQTPTSDQNNQGVLQIGTNNTMLAQWTSSQDGNLLPGGITVSDASLGTASSLYARILCDGPAGAPGCYYSTGWLGLVSPKVYLGDDYDPLVSNVTGAASTATTWKGTENLAYAATDGGSGVARFRLYVDGQQTVDHVVDNSTGHCQIIATDNGNWVFGHSKPCPASVNAIEAIDSTAIADGQHTIVARVVDASQRQATIMNGSAIVVANHPPVNTAPPALGTGTSAPIVGVPISVAGDGRGAWTGPNITYTTTWEQCDASGGCAQIPGATGISYTPTSADVGHRLRYAVAASNPAASVTAYSPLTGVVSAPSSAEAPIVKPGDGAAGSNGANGGTATTPGIPPLPAPSPVAQHALNGQVAGERPGVACPGEQAVLVLEHVKGNTMRLGHGKTGTAQVQLTCKTTGKPISGAKLDIATQVVGQAAVAADITTDGAGHATLRLAKGASRGITVGYRMFADDPIARATATLKVLVPSSLLVKANKRSVRNGQAVTLKGALAGGLIPRRGVNLAVQWKDGKRWRPFAQIKTNAKGAFKYAYRFTRTNRRVVYRLRVQVGSGQVDYPYVATASKTIKVTVAP